MLTVAEVAERWKCSPALIYALLNAGQLHCYRLGLGRGAIRFSEQHLADYLQTKENGHQESSAPIPAPARVKPLKNLSLD